MTQYFDNFSSYSIDAVPPTSYWTGYGWATVTWHARSYVESRSTGNVLCLQDIDWGTATAGYYRTEVGTHTPSAPLELEMKFRLVTNTPTGYTGQRSASAALVFGRYEFTPVSSVAWWGARDYGDFITGGSYVSKVASVDVWFRAWFRRETNGVFKASLWDDSGSRPGTPDFTSSADTTYLSGTLGVATQLNGVKLDIAWVGIGTQGDAAPTAPLVAGTLYAPEFVASVRRSIVG